MNRVVVVGSLNLDIFLSGERLPKPGETLAAREMKLHYGGKGANQAVGAARLGAEVGMVGRVGADAFGEQLLDNLRANGVGAEHVQRDPAAASGTAVVVVDDRGENTVLVVAGANGTLAPGHVLEAQPMIARADVLVTQLEIPRPTVEAAIGVAAEAGVLVILNAAPAAPLPEGMLRQAACLVVNEREAEALAGLPVDSVESAEAASVQLRQAGAQAVVVTLGGQGAVVVTEQARQHIPAPCVEVIDTTAAGDAFVAALAAMTARGQPLLDAARTAVAAGALAVTRAGSQPALPTADELAQFLAGSLS